MKSNIAVTITGLERSSSEEQERITNTVKIVMEVEFFAYFCTPLSGGTLVELDEGRKDRPVTFFYSVLIS